MFNSMREVFSSKVIDDVRSDYAAGELTIDASNSNSSDNNPAVDNAFKTVYRPSVKKGLLYEYLKYGYNDDLDTTYDALQYKSDTHSGILVKKAKMVTGNELVVEGAESLAKGEAEEWKAITKRCGGVGKGLYDVMKQAAFEYEKCGGVGLDITYDKGFSSIISIRVVPQRNLRCGVPDKNTGDITYYVVRNYGFKVTQLQGITVKEEKIPAFDTLDEKNLRQLLYIKNPHSIDSNYGIPNYLGAYYFIAADFEFGRSIYNSAKNGFQPKVIASFIGRNLSQDQKRQEAANFKSNFQGSDGEQVIVSFIRKPEDAPKYEMLDVKNLDKTIDVMATLNDSKILTAHNITSPTLFGIMVSGKLGGTGNELATAYDLFRATETLPNREMLLNAFQNIIDRTKFLDKLKITIADVEINFGNETAVETAKETKDTLNE